MYKKRQDMILNQNNGVLESLMNVMNMHSLLMNGKIELSNLITTIKDERKNHKHNSYYKELNKMFLEIKKEAIKFISQTNK